MEIDATNAPTTPFEAGPEHVALARLIGSWEGPTRTWLDPTAPPDESRTRARIEALLGGRFVRMDYQGTVAGTPHAGQMILGWDAGGGRYFAHWIDSFHMGALVMVSVGKRDAEGQISLLGSYSAGSETWGWRTVIRALDGQQLAVDAYNISPTGHEDHAIETRLAKR